MNPSGNAVGVGATAGGDGLGVSRFEGFGPGQLVSRKAKIAASPQESHKCRSDELIAGQGIQIWAPYRQSGSDRLEKQPTDPATAGRHHHYMRDGTLTGKPGDRGQNDADPA